MQDGAGVRQVVEDALRRQGVKLRDLDVRLELGLQESVSVRSRRGTASRSSPGPPWRPISQAGGSRRHAWRARRDPGDLARVHVAGRGADASRRRVRCVRPRAARAVIVRWGLGELGPLLGDVGIERPLLVTSARFADLEIPVAERFVGVRAPTRRSMWSQRPPTRLAAPTDSSRLVAAARSTRRRRSRPRRPPVDRFSDDVLRLRVDGVLRHARRGARCEHRGWVRTPWQSCTSRR